MTYLELISQDAKANEKKQKEFQAKEAAHSVSVTLLETEKLLFQRENELEQAAKAIPYDLQAEIDLRKEIEALKETLDVAQKIQKERFPLGDAATS